MTQSYCMKCMRKLDGSPVCSRCGYDNSRPSHAQPYHTARFLFTPRIYQ